MLNFVLFGPEIPQIQALLSACAPTAVFACISLSRLASRGTTNACVVSYQVGDYLMFSRETRGLPSTILDALPAEQ